VKFVKHKLRCKVTAYRTCMLQNLILAQLVSKLTASSENRRFISATSRTHSQLSLRDNEFNPHPIKPVLVSLRPILILSSHRCLCPQSRFFSKFSDRNFAHLSNISKPQCSTHLIVLYVFFLIIFAKQ